MNENDAVKKVAQATVALAESIARAFPEQARAELQEWQRQQDGAFEAREAEARRDLERFRASRGDSHWRRR